MYQKTRDMLSLVESMQGSAEGITLDDIRQRCDCSLRTAQRIIAELADIFPTMYSFCVDGRVKRWRIPSNAIAPLFALQSEEMTALASCIEYLKQQNMMQQAQLLKSLEGKINTVIQSSRKTKSLTQDIETLLKHEGLAFRQGPQFHVNDEVLKSLRYALINKKLVKMRYYHKGSDKTNFSIIEPYGILYSDRHHYLLARYSDGYHGDTIQHFILSNILSVELLEQGYQLPDSFNLKEYCQDMFGVFKGKPFDVEWLFDKEVAHEVKRYNFHPTQTITENKDGSITVKFRASGKLEMSWHLYTWGDNVKVIKPKNFWNNL